MYAFMYVFMYVYIYVCIKTVSSCHLAFDKRRFYKRQLQK